MVLKSRIRIHGSAILFLIIFFTVYQSYDIDVNLVRVLTYIYIFIAKDKLIMYSWGMTHVTGMQDSDCPLWIFEIRSGEQQQQSYPLATANLSYYNSNPFILQHSNYSPLQQQLYSIVTAIHLLRNRNPHPLQHQCSSIATSNCFLYNSIIPPLQQQSSLLQQPLLSTVLQLERKYVM